MGGLGVIDGMRVEMRREPELYAVKAFTYLVVVYVLVVLLLSTGLLFSASLSLIIGIGSILVSAGIVFATYMIIRRAGFKERMLQAETTTFLSILLFTVITVIFVLTRQYVVLVAYFLTYILALYYLHLGNVLSNVFHSFLIQAYNIPWLSLSLIISPGKLLGLQIAGIVVLAVSIIPLYTIVEKLGRMTVRPKVTGDRRVILIKYPDAQSLLTTTRQSRLLSIMDKMFSPSTEAIILISKPFGILSKLFYHYLAVSLSAAAEEFKLREIYELTITTSKITAIPEKFTRELIVYGGTRVSIESRIVGAEPFIVDSLVREKLFEETEKLVLVDDVADLVYVMGAHKAYNLLRSIALSLTLSNVKARLVLFLPIGVLDEASEKLFTNLADEAIVI